MAYEGEIPFHPFTGELQTWPQKIFRPTIDGGERADPVWQDNFEFDTTLNFVEFSRRGRSAVHAIFEDRDTHHRYVVFLTDLARIILEGKLNSEGGVRAKWTFVKRGSNYGACLA